MKVFILGFTKCGTTSLYDALAMHPAVSAPRIKEPHYYFSKVEGVAFEGVADNDSIEQMFVRNERDYNALYDMSKSIQLDGSAMTIESIDALTYLRASNPKSKAIIMVRDVIDRSFSAYSHMIRDAREDLTFIDALSEEACGNRERWLPIWSYINSSRYIKRVLKARELFGDDLLLLNFSDYIRAPSATLDSVSEFIGIEKINWTPVHSNKSGIPRSAFLQRVMQRNSLLKRLFVSIFPRKFVNIVKGKILEVNVGEKVKINDVERALLVENLRDEIELLENLCGNDKEVLADVYRGVK